MPKKLDRVFRIAFYPQDWLIDTNRLSLEERGLFIQIVMLIYANRGPIEQDFEWIARNGNCSVRMVKTIIKTLLEKDFIQIYDAKITQRRAEKELNFKREHLELSAKGGRTTAENEGKESKIKDIPDTEPQTSVCTPIAIAIAIDDRKKKNRKMDKKKFTEIGNWKARDYSGDSWRLKPENAHNIEAFPFGNFRFKEGMTADDLPENYNPKDDFSNSRFDPWKFEGTIIKLRKSDFEEFQNLYPGDAEQFYKYLDGRDNWYAKQPPERQSTWFMSTKKNIQSLK